MTPRAVVSSVDEPPGRSDLGGRRTPQLQVRATAVPAEAGRGRRSESPQLKPTILTLPRPWDAGIAPATLLHLEGAPRSLRICPSTRHILAGQEHLSFAQHAVAPLCRESPGLAPDHAGRPPRFSQRIGRSAVVRMSAALAMAPIR